MEFCWLIVQIRESDGFYVTSVGKKPYRASYDTRREGYVFGFTGVVGRKNDHPRITSPLWVDGRGCTNNL